jgi:hypothetical protein
LIEESGASGYDNYSIGLTDAEQQYYKIMRESGEFAFVGAGLYKYKQTACHEI